MSLYLAIEIFCIIIPLLYTFNKKLLFYKKLKVVLISLTIVASIYITGDIFFTYYGVWGFNSRYHSNVMLFNLPLEEWLFFFIIPYASIFLHDTIIYIFPKAILTDKWTRIISILLITLLSIIVIIYYKRVYTSIYFGILIIILSIAEFNKTKILNRFYLTFMVILIPFFLTNAILTGSFIDQEVVWYNNAENLGIRTLTVPIEDFGYAFSLILLNLIFINKVTKA